MMYKKIKYFTYAFLFIAIFFVIMDAQSRYSKIEEKKNQEKILQQISEDTNKRSLSQNENQQSNVEVQPEIEETQNTQIDSTMNQNKTNESNEFSKTESKDEQDESNSQTSQKTKLTLANGMDATEYNFIEKFSLENAEYVVISHADTKYSSSYSKFTNRQYYVYKINGEELHRIYYLFERSDKKENYVAEKMNISSDKFETTFSYSSKPPIVRKISNNVLKNNSSLYKNTENLFLKQEKIEQKNEDEETTNDNLR